MEKMLFKPLSVTLAGLVLLAAAVFPGCFQNSVQEPVYNPEDLIRLHVVAHSDSEADQDLKRKVRDELVRDLAPQFLAAQDVESARLIARASLGRIQETAARVVKAEGKDYPVGAELGRFAFPARHYGPFMLPAGEYEAVRVVIGDGAGANWWCVLFPPLCFVDMSRAATAPAGPAPGGFAADGPPAATAAWSAPSLPETPAETATVEFRFKILELFKNPAHSG